MAARPAPPAPAALPQPKNFDQLYPGRFLKAGTLDGHQVTVTIAKIEHEKIEGEKGVELKAIFTFVGKDMQLVCCKTNAMCIKAMFGPMLADWIGKRITLFEGKVETPGKMFGQPCLRIWGSPEIPADLTIQIKHPKKKAFDMVMHKVESRPATGGAAPGPATTPATSAPPPAPATQAADFDADEFPEPPHDAR